MKLFGIIGVWEAVLIIVIICVLFGPALFIKLGKRAKSAGKAAKKGVENGAKAAGADVDLNNISKDTVLNKIEGLQNRVDKAFDSEDAGTESKDDSTSKEIESEVKDDAKADAS